MAERVFIEKNALIEAAYYEQKVLQTSILQLLGATMPWQVTKTHHFISHSGDLRQEIEEDKIKDTLERLCSHSNAIVVKEAITTLQVLRGETPQ